jgi:hypothetical protein
MRKPSTATLPLALAAACSKTSDQRQAPPRAAGKATDLARGVRSALDQTDHG